MKTRLRIFSRVRLLPFATAVLLVVILAMVLPRQITYLYEDITFKLDPTAAHAFAIGEEHFTASSGSYDIARAEHFFQLAAASDPSYPYVYHELARIAFIRGDLAGALALINHQIKLHGDTAPNSYYVRGLIEGFMENYPASEADYAYFLKSDPKNWAAMNDYAWVLLKDRKYQAAAEVTAQGLALYPVNPWLLNSRAIALFEMGSTTEALRTAGLAIGATRSISADDWLHAYPGNDPRDAAEGIDSLRSAADDNMHMIQAALAPSTVQ